MTALYLMKPVMLLLLVAVGGPAAPSLCAAHVTGAPLQPHPATFRRSLQQQISTLGGWLSWYKSQNPALDAERATTEEPIEGPQSQDRTGAEEPDQTPPGSEESEAPSTDAPVATRAPSGNAGQKTTGDVIDPEVSSVLFFSDNDKCNGIERQQKHPDWVEGQSSDGTNSDGTPDYGFAFNTGDSTKGEIEWDFRASDIALSGDCVLAMGIAGAYDNKRAIRIFRRRDRNGADLPDEAYYSVWFYFPEDISFDASVGGRFGFWNVFQVKNRVNDESLANLSVDAGMIAGRENAMHFNIWKKSLCGASEECDRAETISASTDIAIPVREWVHLEMYLKARQGPDGQVIVWQDGQEIINYSGQTERSGATKREWSVNNYGQLHRPASHTLFVDDVLISTSPVHDLLFD